MSNELAMAHPQGGYRPLSAVSYVEEQAWTKLLPERSSILCDLKYLLHSLIDRSIVETPLMATLLQWP